jgi:hypothetical protein
MLEHAALPIDGDDEAIGNDDVAAALIGRGRCRHGPFPWLDLGGAMMKACPAFVQLLTEGGST